MSRARGESMMRRHFKLEVEGQFFIKFYYYTFSIGSIVPIFINKRLTILTTKYRKTITAQTIQLNQITTYGSKLIELGAF